MRTPSGGDAARSLPRLIVAALLVAVAVNGIGITWLCATADSRCPGTYMEGQLKLWLHETRTHPDSPLAWVTLAGLYESLGEASKAAEAYDTALALDASNPAALLNRADRDQAAGDYDAAREHILRAIELQPAWSAYRGWYRLGVLEEAAGRPDVALVAYETSTGLCRTCWRSHYRMALLYEQSGDTERALAAIGEAFRYAPGDSAVASAFSRLAAE
jgi:tetratricopeptide (TPR) repeat protein